MRHKWKTFFMAREPIWPAQCEVCKEISMCSADWCDSIGIVNWIEKIINQDDCKGVDETSN